MKYEDWKAKLDAIEKKKSALYAQIRPHDNEWCSVANLIERWWRVDDVIAFHVVGERWALWHRQHRFELPSHQWTQLTSVNLRVVADLLATVERWKAGALAELPPSNIEGP